MGKTNISWCDQTWNIARGCTKVDTDCRFCYMYRDSFDSHRYNPLEVVRTKTVFNFPLKYKETKSACWVGRPLIFTSSLTDVFHIAIDSYRNDMWDIIRQCPHLIFQILTKRPERIPLLLPEDWGDGWDNVWLGTSVGNHNAYQRISDLFKVKCKFRFLSLEPLYDELDLMYPKEVYPDGPKMCCSGQECGCQGQPIEPPFLYGIDWVIVGGESGNEKGKYQYRPCELEWIERIVADCKRLRVPVFVKQTGTYLSKQLKLKSRHGTDINEWPESIRIQEFPVV